MKIAYDYQVFALQKFGGVSRYYAELAKELFKGGESIGVFAPFHQNCYLKELDDNIVCGHYLNKYPPLTTPFLKLYNSWCTRTKISKWNPDIVHETYYLNDRSIFKNAPTVITVHDMIHELFAGQFSASKEISEKKYKAVKRADHVICVSKNTKKDLIRLFDIPKRKVSVVYHGIDNYKNQNKNDSKVKISKPFIFYVGKRNGYKNFTSLLKIYECSSRLKKDFKLVAFGGGQLSHQEVELINKLGLSEVVMQIDGNDKMLSDLYYQASAFIYPSLYEGFGMPLLEAMAHGCPVIASNRSSIPEVVDGAGELFDPFSLDEIRDSIEKVLYSEENRKKIISKGYERLSHFSWRQCANETVKIYKKVLNKEAF